ncbi:MAG: T9SS type A sorting domain-containing protein [Flavobacteriaceae bacterium]|nr:T9SS type A sorting domain-containing protein [Flavobacteriaceae bacterium]
MKNYKFVLIALFISFFSFQSHAQYESIFGESTTKMQTLFIDFMPVEFATGTDGYFSNSTVSIEGKEFHDFVWYNTWITGEWEELTSMYYLREEIDEGKVWMVGPQPDGSAPENLEDEVLVVDMSLELGDEFEYYLSPHDNDGISTIVNVIDVYYENDKKHIVFDRNFDPSFGQDLQDWETLNLMFIEGFGSTFGYSIWGNYTMASCVEKDGIIYENPYQPLADLCETETFSSPNEEFTNTSLYPNPASTTFQINYPQEIGTSDLKIYDLQGKLMHHEANYQQQEINVQDLASGIYFVELRGENGQQWKKKLIKE